MNNTCAICGEKLSVKLSHKLKCGTPDEPHEFHYECLLKTFSYNHNIEKDRKCPYCRKGTEYLPLVSGLKKVVPGIHCSFYDFKNKKQELNGYHVKCSHILTRGKRKNEMCGKNCQLGFQYCGTHNKSQLKFDTTHNIIVKKQGDNASEDKEKASEVSQ